MRLNGAPALATIFLLLLLARPTLGADYINKVKLIRQDTYACAATHLHLPGYVTNTADVTLIHIQVEGRVFDREGHLLATSVARAMTSELRPGDSATFDVEFVEITEPHFGKVGDVSLRVIQALPK